MRFAHTAALLALPKAAWDFIAAAMDDAGYDTHFVTTDDEGAATVALDMQGIAVIPSGDSDQMINSGRLSDLMVQSNEESFRAGFTAGMAFANDTSDEAPNVNRAWDNYEPSDAIMDLQDDL